MTEDIEQSRAKGVSKAQFEIANGCPYWLVGPNASSTLENTAIDLKTGLPIIRYCTSPELFDRLSAHIRGYNEEILRALSAGEIKIDFRPLLMDRHQLEREFSENQLGVLSLENPRIDDPNGRFTLYLKVPKPRKNRKSEPHIWAVFELTDGEVFEQFWLYDAPVAVALGLTNKVLILKTDLLFLSYDVQTTQSLNRYLHHWPNGEAVSTSFPGLL